MSDFIIERIECRVCGGVNKCSVIEEAIIMCMEYKADVVFEFNGTELCASYDDLMKSVEVNED